MDIKSLYWVVYNTAKEGLNNGLIRNQKGIPEKGIVHVHNQIGMDFINKVITDFPPNVVTDEIAEALCISVSNMRSSNGLEWIAHLFYKNEPLVHYVRSVLWENKIDSIISEEQQSLLDAM